MTRRIALVAAVLSCVLHSVAEAQLVPAYQATHFQSTYSEIGGGTLHALHPADDTVFTNVPIGFPFVFNGTVYNEVSISTNGWIRFGGAPAANEYNPLSSTSSLTTNSFSAFGRNLNARTSSPTGSLRSEVVGEIGTRFFIIQFKDYQATGLGSAGRVNFQIVLAEGFNALGVVYGPMVAPASTGPCQVGLKGNSTANVRSVAVSGSWTSPTFGTDSGATCLIGNSAAGLPPSGYTYLFTPPVTPVFGVGAATVSEGNSGTTILNVPVTIVEPQNNAMSVQYSTVDGSARSTAGDFTGASGATLNIPANAVSATIQIAVTGDVLPEFDEQFQVVLSNPSAGSIGAASAVQTILDDDRLCSAPETFAGTTGTTPPGGWQNLDLNGGAPDLWQFATPTSCAPGKVRAFMAPIALPFAIYDSDACGVSPEVEETALVTPSFPVGDILTASLEWDEIYKGFAGIEAAVEVSTNGGANWTALLVQSSANSGNPEVGIPAARSIEVGDLIRNQPDVRFRFRFRGDFGYWWIVDNVRICQGVLPVGSSLISVGSGSGTEGNAFQSNIVSIPVTLSPANPSTVTVSYDLLDGTAQLGTHFNGPASGAVQFVPPATTANILVSTIGNDAREVSRNFGVRLRTPVTGSAFISGSGEATATILNDDPLPPGFAFGIDNSVPGTGAAANAVFEFDPNAAPSTIRRWAPAISSSHAGGDFVGHDFTKFYAIETEGAPSLVVIDTLTLEQTTVGPLALDANEAFRGLAFDRTSGSLWALSTREPATPGGQATLYRINHQTGATLSKVDFMQTTAGLYRGLFVREDGFFFTVETNSDRLVRLRRQTGQAFPVNFALTVDLQNAALDGDFDDGSNLLYLVARDNTAPFRNKLYWLDSSLGVATFIQTLSVAPYDLGGTTAFGIAREFSPGVTAARSWMLYE